MGASTYTYTVTPLTIMGDKRVHRVRYVISSYGTDGVSLTPAIAGLAAIDAIIGVTIRTAVANGPVAAIWNDSANTLIFHKSSNAGVDAATVFNADVVAMGS